MKTIKQNIESTISDLTKARALLRKLRAKGAPEALALVEQASDKLVRMGYEMVHKIKTAQDLIGKADYVNEINHGIDPEKEAVACEPTPTVSAE